MANRAWKQLQGTLTDGVVILTGSFTTTTGGTIGTSDCEGFSVAKTAAEAGRYTVTLADAYYAFRGAVITLEGAADAAYTTDKGIITPVRNVSASGKTFDVQFAPGTGASYADADLEDGAKVYLVVFVKNSSL